MTVSDHVRVVLDDVKPSLTGEYLCEVTVTPTFFVLADSANMTVIGEFYVEMIKKTLLKKT